MIQSVIISKVVEVLPSAAVFRAMSHAFRRWIWKRSLCTEKNVSDKSNCTYARAQIHSQDLKSLVFILTN